MIHTEFAKQLDIVQIAVTPMLKEHGFKKRGRTFNRLSPDGLTLVINFQMGAFDPPGTTYFPGLRENLYGYFTLNLGIYVPEVALYHLGGEARNFVQDYHCCIRARLGDLGPEMRDIWWRISSSAEITSDLQGRLEKNGLPFLQSFETRERILRDWPDYYAQKTPGWGSPPNIISAIILVGQGHYDIARKLLEEQARDAHNPGHPEYVRDLASRLGIPILDK